MLETRLTDIFSQVSHWKANLLLDEADVVVEDRAKTDLHRNALVSAFLRKLEYYEGILFLTTNRVQTFDEAMTSRIHLALPYHPLGQRARIGIWRSFLEKARTEERAAACLAKDIEQLARKKLNGREVRWFMSSHCTR